MKQVLIITDVNFWKRSSGNSMRIYSLIEYLSNHVQLTVVNTGPTYSEEIFLHDIFKVEFHVLEKTKYLNSNGYGRKLKTFLKGKDFDTIIIEYIHCSYFLNFLIADCQVILDTHDIISERTDEFKKFNYQKSLYEMSRKDEARLFAIYDNVIMINKPDFDKACSMTNCDKVLLCPHPFNIHPHVPNSDVKNISFIASAYLPNIDGINYFIKNCWEKIHLRYGTELNIYGTVCHEVDLSSQTDIKLHGYVEDVNLIYESADIVINPVRFGAGLKIKNLEALAHGKPLITMSHGVRGLESGVANAFLKVSNTHEFVATLSELIEDEALRAKLSGNAHEFIKANFSADQCFNPLIKAITA